MAARPAARTVVPARVRLGLMGLAFVLAWAGLGYRLFEVQVVRASEYAEKGLAQRLTRRTVAPTRGKIFDRNGDPLAMTVEAKSIYAVPAQVEEPLWVAQQIGGLLGAERLIMGSDWPHAEGLHTPTEYVRELEGFGEAEVRSIMREAGLSLATRRPA